MIGGYLMPKGSAAKLDDARKAEILDLIREFREIAENGNQERMERMRKAEDFVTGDQWDPALQAAMEEKGKICLSIPLIRPQIKQMVGHVVQNPREITVKNLRGGLKVLADVQSALIKHLVIDQDAQHQIVQWFDQGSTTGSSYLALLLDMDSDPLHGNLEIRRLNEFEVLPDPTCQVYDPNQRKVGARFFIWDSWEDADYIEHKWPDALGAYRSSGASGTSGVRAMGGFLSWLVGSAISGITQMFWRKREAEAIEFEKLRYPVTHCWWKQHKKVQFFYDHRQSDLDALILTEKKDIAAARKAVEQYGEQVFELREAIVPQINHTIALGDVLLEHIEDEFNLIQTGESLFPVVPFHAFFNNGFTAGIAEDMIGVQEFINWTRSQVVNIMKNQPNSGWIIGQDVGHKAKWLEAHAGQDGIVIDKSAFGGYVEKIAPAPMPQLEHLTQLGREEIREVSNIRTENPEHEPKQMSGRAILAKQQASLQGVSPVMANFDYSLAIFGKVCAGVIRANPVYSDSEIREIVEEKKLIDPQLLQECREAVATAVLSRPLPPPPAPLDPFILQGLQPHQISQAKNQYQQHVATYQKLIEQIDQQARPMAIQALIDAMRNPRRGRYNCRVALSPASLTSRTRELMELMEVNEMLLNSGYQPLPEKVILEATDLHDKEEILSLRGYA